MVASTTTTTTGILLFFTMIFSQSIWLTCSCSNILVTPGASDDSSSMIAYNADSASLMGYLYHYPAQKNIPENTKRLVYEWDTGKYLGAITEASETYNVVGNINEYGLIIGETTFGGLEILLNQPGAIIDYGSLIYLTLQRSKTARDAIETISTLLDTYGYYSEGESFSIADPNEVWHMELIGRGKGGRLGAVWVAMKVPDGYVSAHANQARITTFPRDDPENCLYSDDVVDLARELGLYGDDESDEDFSFSDIYDPVTFEGVRFSDARVWSMYSALSPPDDNFMETYTDYVEGIDLTHRMPLFLKPSQKLTLSDIYDLFSDHYDNSPLAFDYDAGAGLSHNPNRPRPLTWEYKSNSYFNERSIATPQTGWNYVAQTRGWLPREFAAIMWFGVDDSSTSPRVPVYGCATELSQAYVGVGPQDGVPNEVLKFDITKAFFVHNMVSNLVYSRWDVMYPILSEKLSEVRETFHFKSQRVEAEALQLYHKTGSEEAVQRLTQATVHFGDEMQTLWLKFYGELFVRFRDGYDITPNADDTECQCTVGNIGMSHDWKQRIVDETDAHYNLKTRDGVKIAADGHVVIDAGAATATTTADDNQTTHFVHKPKNKLLLKSMM